MADRRLRQRRDLGDPQDVLQAFRRALRCRDAACTRIEVLASLGDPLAQEATRTKAGPPAGYEAWLEQIPEHPGALDHLALEFSARCTWAFSEAGEALPSVVERVVSAVTAPTFTSADLIALRFDLDDQWPRPSLYGSSLQPVEALLHASLDHLLRAVAGLGPRPGNALLTHVIGAAASLIADERNPTRAEIPVARDLVFSLLRGWAIEGPPQLPSLDPEVAKRLARYQGVGQLRSPWTPAAGAASEVGWALVLGLSRRKLSLAAALGLEEARQLLGSDAPLPPRSTLDDAVADYRFAVASLVGYDAVFASRVLRKALTPCVRRWERTFPGNPAIRRASAACAQPSFDLTRHLEACSLARAIAEGARESSMVRLCEVVLTMLRARAGQAQAYPLYGALLEFPALLTICGVSVADVHPRAFRILQRAAIPMLCRHPSGWPRP